jgi:hypothetical protein
VPAFDLIAFLLVLGLLALASATAATSLAIRPIRWWTRHRRSQPVMHLAIPRRVITGRPPTLPAEGRQPNPGHFVDPPDDRRATSPVRAAARYDTPRAAQDPERLAEVLTHWINNDPDPEEHGYR